MLAAQSGREEHLVVRQLSSILDIDNLETSTNFLQLQHKYKDG
jgi:hypothetical protein